MLSTKHTSLRAPQGFKPEQLLRYMPRVQHQQQELRLVEAAWDHLALLSSLSRLSSKASASSDLGRARQDFAALSTEMMQGLSAEAMKDVQEDLGTKAQVCIDILVRNLYERSADIGFFSTDATVSQFLADPCAIPRLAMEQHLQAYAAKYSVYSNIVLLEPTGQCVARLKESGAAEISRPYDLDFLRRTLSAPRMYQQDYGLHGFCHPDQQTLVFAQAVEGNHTTVGVLCLEFDLQDEAQALFASILDDGDGLWEVRDVVLALIDADGRVIESSDALQLPTGWVLAGMTTAGSFALQHMGRRYAAVARDTTGFQGYGGLGWRGVALIPLDLAFEDSPQTDDSPLMQEAAGNADLLPMALRQIPDRSAAIQSALERSVWNGLLDLNRTLSDGSDAHARDVSFAKTLLSEIGITARKTAQAFATALHDLHSVVMASTLRDTQSRTSLVMQILDRNLYERANDCRWWALTPQFASTLTAGTEHCPGATRTLKAINALYTVYSCLVLFDRNGKVLAVSNDQYASQVGQVLQDAWADATILLGSSQDYVVSDFVSSRFYSAGPTYTYAAAVRANASAGPVLGGIAVVWDATAQMKSILADCAAGMGNHDTLALLDAQGTVLHYHGGAALHRAALHRRLQSGDTVVEMDGHLYGLAQSTSPGYREFGQPGGHQHGLRCIALRHLCRRQTVRLHANSQQTTQHSDTGRFSRPLQLATFNQGTHWLALDSSMILMAAPDVTVAAAASTQAPFLGIATIQDTVYPVIDLRSVIHQQAVPSVQADPARQLLVLQIRTATGKMVAFALRVDRLGSMLDLDHSQLQPISMPPTGAAPPMMDAVVHFGTPQEQQSTILCQISRNWLQYCVSNLRGEFSAQNLDTLQIGQRIADN